VIALVVVVLDEAIDVGFEVARQIIVLQQDAVLERPVPAFDLALGLRMIGCAAHVSDALCDEPFCEIARDIAGAVVAEQARLVNHPCLVAA
jgi:hypothetical protein